MPKQTEQTPYATSYRNIRYPRLEFKTGTLLLVLPKNYRNQKELLEKHQKWINQKQETIQTALEQSRHLESNTKRTVKDLKVLANTKAYNCQKELSIKIRKIAVRTMKTKWGSLSKKGTLTVNTLAKHLPQSLVEYIIYHETAHAKHGKRHNEAFWKQITTKYPNHNTIENQLLAYWFQIQKTASKKPFK